MVRGTALDFCIFIILLHAIMGSTFALLALLASCN
jgi:hypothetical protein